MKNHVLEIIESYLKAEKMVKENRVRPEYDDDAKYYYEVKKLSIDESLHADTIISFWTPYARLLQLEANWVTTKSIGHLNNLIYQITTDRKTGYNEAIKKVNKQISEFAEICYNKGNYMLLPEKRMNFERYKLTEDRIDLTLYECFKNGKLSHYFNNNDEMLIQWIGDQKLDFLFENQEINKNTMKWFVPNRKKITQMSADEIYKYLDNAITFIKHRSNQQEN